MPVKPSSKEEEYFLVQEVARLKKLRDEHARKLVEEERRQMRDAHYLRCAKCGQKMETTTLVTVEVEVCPDCGGLYLDAGELQKIMNEETRGLFANALATVRRLWNS